MRVALSRQTTSFSICEHRDSCPMSGIPSGKWILIGKSEGKCWEDHLRFAKSREQKKLAPSFPSANVVSANVWAMVDFPVPAGHSARKHTGPVRPLTNVRSPRGHPSSFPSGVPACSQNGDQHPECEACHSEACGPHVPIHRSVCENERQESETRHEPTTLIVNILLQRSLLRASEVPETDSLWTHTWYSIIASRISSTRPPSLPALSTLLRKPSTFPCFSNGPSSRRIFPSFLMIPVCQARLETLASMGLLFQSLSTLLLLGITLRNGCAE